MFKRLRALFLVAAFAAGVLSPACPTHAAETGAQIKSGYYIIRSGLNKNFVVGVAAASANEKANVELQRANGSPYQTFYVEANGSTCIIRNAASDFALDVAGGKKEARANVWQFKVNKSAAQRWKSIANEDGSYSFIGVGSGKALDVAGGKAGSGKNLWIFNRNQTAAQKWDLLPVANPKASVKNGCYVIQSASQPKLVLDVDSGKQEDRVNIRLYRSNNTNAQKWYITRYRDDLYRIQNANSLKVMDVASGSKQDRANVQQFAWNQTRAQLWRIFKNTDGSLTFLAAGSGKALDVAGGKLATYSNVQQYKANGTAAQRWKLKSASAKPLSVAESQKNPTSRVNRYVQIIAKGNPALALQIASGNLKKSTRVTLADKSVGTNDKWSFVDRGDGTYEIISVQSGQAMDVRKRENKNGTAIQQYTRNSTTAQRFRAVETGDMDGSYYLINTATGKYLDITGGKIKSGTALQLYKGNKTLAQKFYIQPSAVTTMKNVLVNGQNSAIRSGKVVKATRPTFSYAGISNAYDPYGVAWSSRNAQGVPYAVAAYAKRYARYDADWYQDTSKKTIYLTFNDGIGNESVLNSILNTLRVKNVKATFFLTGSVLRYHPTVVRRIINEGHQVGNHSWSHPTMPNLSAASQENEMRTFNRYLKANFGYDCQLFRFPSGEFSELGLAVANNVGMKSVFYTFAYNDWDSSNQPGTSYAYSKVTDAIRPGAIILMHSNSTTNAAILGSFIDEARRRGYTFASYYPEW